MKGLFKKNNGKVNAWYTSDLHEGHKNIGKFRNLPKEFLDAADGNGTEANKLWLDYWWDKLVAKRDTVYCAGDNAFTEKGVDTICSRRGNKIMFGGNHDDLPVSSYLRAFSSVRGCKKIGGVGWVSHFPLHPDELRGHFSIHGHVHYQTIDDWRYINISCDNLFEETGQPLVTKDDLIWTMEYRRENQDSTRILLEGQT